MRCAETNTSPSHLKRMDSLRGKDQAVDIHA